MLTQNEAFQALLEGEEVQCRYPEGGAWVKVRDVNLLLDENLELRVAPQVIVANGIEIPLGYQGKMMDQQTYFMPNLFSNSCHGSTIWEDSEFDNLMLKRGLVFTTKEEAIAYAEAIIKLSGGDPL